MIAEFVRQLSTEYRQSLQPQLKFLPNVAAGNSRGGIPNQSFDWC